MRATIHHGAHEIGGSCVEIEHNGSRLVLDVGKPLDASEEEVSLPDVSGFIELDPSLLGVLITHGHQDHWGLIGQISPDVPLYMDADAHRILTAADFWTTGLSVPLAGGFKNREPLQLGPFAITPFLVDHSAYGACSLLVEAGGRRLFYTGDIRGHGRKGKLFEALVNRPPENVDVLLMEGTNVQPDESASADKRVITEDQVEDEAATTIRDTKGIVCAQFSAQNIDRLVTLFRAARRNKRVFVMDAYTACMARATGNDNIPVPGDHWPDVKVFIPSSQQKTIKERKAWDLLEELKPYRVFDRHLSAAPNKYVMKVSNGSLMALDRWGCLQDASLIWSLWSGYLEEASGQWLKDFLVERSIPLRIHHTSGHASVADLKRLAEAITPGRLVPIHSFGSERFPSLFSNVKAELDGVWWEV